MNVVIMSGRLGKDPELRTTTQGTSVCDFSIAVESGYGDKKKTNWNNCIAWSKTAEWICEGAAKGDELTIKGELESGSYENNDGKKVYWTKVNVQEFKISKPHRRDEDDRDEEPPARGNKPSAKKKSAYNPLEDDEDD